MSSESREASRRPTSVDLVGDVVDSVRRYARQETVEPMRGAARWVGAGLVAALSLGVATLYLALGILRLSQDLGGSVLDGAWSFVHYLVTVVVLVAVVAVVLGRTRRSSLAKGS